MVYRKIDLMQLEEALGYHFSSLRILEEAITHVSAGVGLSYQRLEFLGDHVLGLVISYMLFEAFPNATEGELSKRLGALVRKETCAEVARHWRLDSYIRLGQGERRSGAKKNEAILGDICEAVIGAVYCDGGLSAAEKLIESAWRVKMEAIAVAPKDAKTTLQEVVQAKGFPVPVYRDIGRTGPDHAPQFEISVEAGGKPEVIGTGNSKRVAEHAAAKAWLVKAGLLNVNGKEDL